MRLIVMAALGLILAACTETTTYVEPGWTSGGPQCEPCEGCEDGCDAVLE